MSVPYTIYADLLTFPFFTVIVSDKTNHYKLSNILSFRYPTCDANGNPKVIEIGFFWIHFPGLSNAV